MPHTNESLERLLDLELGENDAGAPTVRAYLTALLTAFWKSGEEGLSGKKPFGNSGWQNEIYYVMVRAGLVDGEVDGPYLEYVDQREADSMVLAAIKHMGCPQDQQLTLF